MDANTIAMMTMIMGSWITIFGAILWQSYRHDDSIKSVNTSVAGLETRVTALETKVDAMGGKVDAMGGKVDAMGCSLSDARERLARIEGCLLVSEDRRMRDTQPPADIDPSTHDSPPDG